MKTKEQKLAQLDKYIERLGVSREDVINHWQPIPKTRASAIKVFNKTEYANIKPGMFWHEDDTFSFERVADKKIKTIVELVEDGVVYGDLTASELFDISEKRMSWYDAERFFGEFSYPCRENEKIVWYSIEQFLTVYNNYKAVKKAFEKLHKPFRKEEYWSSTEYNATIAWGLNFTSGFRIADIKYINWGCVRPVLALKIA